jgi:hypothetical protein
MADSHDKPTTSITPANAFIISNALPLVLYTYNQRTAQIMHAPCMAAECCSPKNGTLVLSKPSRPTLVYMAKGNAIDSGQNLHSGTSVSIATR